jgi:uncharacterized protein (DUF58 family)
MSATRRSSSPLPFIPWRPPILETGPLTLASRRLYILPTRPGLVFALLLLGLLVGAINYGVSLAYLFTFWLVALALLGILHTQRNLSGLVLRAGVAAPVFVGETARFRLMLENPSGVARRGIRLRHLAGEGEPGDLPAGASGVIELPLPQTERGWFSPGRFAIHSEYPLGLFRCWSVLDLDWGVLVYPKPAADAWPLPTPRSDDTEDDGGHSEGVEFHGLRGYQAGDSQRRIAWKAVARGGDALLTKQFVSGRGRRLWLNWWLTPERDTEGRLSRLTRWVLEAHAAGLAYGIKLPGRTLPPRVGEAHMRQCLEVLARYVHV